MDKCADHFLFKNFTIKDTFKLFKVQNGWGTICKHDIDINKVWIEWIEKIQDSRFGSREEISVHRLTNITVIAGWKMIFAASCPLLSF